MTNRNKKFIALSLDICRRTDLTPTEKLVLARVASFEVYFESTSACAELLGVTEQTILKSKQKLEKMGMIKCVANDGRGKTYVANDDWRAIPTGKTQEELTRQAQQADKRPRYAGLKPSGSTAPRPQNSFTKWQKEHKDLLHVLDLSTNYLLRHKIPLTDPRSFRQSLVKVADLYRDDKTPDAHTFIIETYLDYLESDEYLYQLEHSKYCPTVSTQGDLFGKFQQIRDFKNNPNRHYDPTKTLTR